MVLVPSWIHLHSLGSKVHNHSTKSLLALGGTRSLHDTRSSQETAEIRHLLCPIPYLVLPRVAHLCRLELEI